MPWQQTDPMNEGMKFLALSQEKLYSHAELCDRFGISRQAGYVLLRRYAAEGIAALEPRSHAPKSCPHRMPADVEALLLEARRAHPTWGPRKIRAYLEPRYPGMPLPAPSTIGDLFSRAGLVEPLRKRRKWTHPGRIPASAEAPNELWTIDFKGEFRTRDGQLCYPLTVADAHTRFILGCDALDSTGGGGVRQVMERLFHTYGLPEVIRSDNGTPFCSKAIAGLSRLSIWWMKAGIGHNRTEPGHPEQNGSHERMHRTLKRETARPPERHREAQQERFDEFCREFNQERPHEALGMKTPGSLYTPSPRELPERLATPEYEGHCQVRRVRGNGILYFRDREIFLSELLIGEDVGLEEVDDGVWSIYFFGLLLGKLDERNWKISG